MRWWRKEAKILVGIDIGVSYVKLLELEHMKQGYFVRQYAVAEFPITVFSDKQEVKNTSTMSATILQLRDTAGIKTNNAVIAVPGTSVVTNEITINANLSEVEMEAQAWLEASHHFPDLVEDLSLDFYITGPSAANKEQLEALLVACRRTAVENLVTAFQNTRFQIDVVDVDYYALERALIYYLQQQGQEIDPQHSYALLNVDSHTSTLVVLKNNRLIYAHDQAFDGLKLLQKLQSEINWPGILLQPTQNTSHAELTLDNVALDTIVNHINYAVELFYTSKHDINLQKLFLAGDCALIPKLAEFVAEKTNIETAIMNPLVNMQLGAQVDAAAIQAVAPALTLCCGLALHKETA